VVVRVLSHVVQVVVLAARADALLTVDGALEAGEGSGGVGAAQENGLKLAHARVGEQQRRVVVRHARRGDVVDVPALLDKVADEGVADASCGPLGGGGGSCGTAAGGDG